MNKYKVGDKIVLTVTGTNGMGYLPFYVLNDDFIVGEKEIDKYSELLSTYIEQLEAKISRQATEIKRLLAENKKLKETKTEDIEHWCDVCTKQSVIEQARAEGQHEAWELARKINDMDIYDTEEIFIEAGAFHLGNVLENYTYSEAAAKVAEWEKAKEEIKVGDEVEKNDLRDVRFIVTFTNGRLMNGVTQSGLVFANEKPKEWHKTGRHIDIDGFLKQIGEE